MTPRPIRRRRDMCPHAYRAALVDQGFAWLGAEIGLFVDIRHPVSGRYFKPLRDERGHVLRTETLAALILWRAETITIARENRRTSSDCIRIAEAANFVAA
jgi:hypothetical protein